MRAAILHPRLYELLLQAAAYAREKVREVVLGQIVVVQNPRVTRR